MIELPTDENPVVVVEGDCLDVLRGLPDGCVDAVVTDPPYSERTHKGHDAASSGPGRTAGAAGYDGAARKTLGYGAWTGVDVALYVPELCRVCRGWVVIMTDHTLAPFIMRTMEESGRYVFAPLPWYSPGSRVRLSGDGPSSWTDWVIVARTAAQHRWGTLPGGYSPDTRPGWRDKERMGGKPVRLMREIVKDYSRPGELVLDPFAGAGTTGVACAIEGRRCLIVEREAEFAAVARRRVADARGTGLLAGLG